MVRTSEGKLEPRLYSPYAGEILQAHNIAAGIAYNAEMQEKGAVDLLSMSQEFPLNPTGFQEAADQYIESVVENAPDAFKADLKGALGKEASRRFLGMVEERHRDIRQRANNSSRALMERWSTNYAEALAAGNDEEANDALAELNSVLQAREALPGVAWTPEQSANVIVDAQRAAGQIVDRQRSEIRKEYKGILDTITKAARAGMHGEDEAVLADPLVQTLLPEEWAEAMAFTTLRDQMPEFHLLPPSQQRDVVAELRASPVSQDFQIDVVNAAERATNENAKAWEDDPIAHANEVLTDKPAQMPDPSVEGLDKFGAWTASRVEYSDRLNEQGYYDGAAYFTKEEAATISAFMKDADIETRAAFAMGIAGGAGDRAAEVFAHLDTDPVLRLSATLAGQELIASQQVRLPQNANQMEAHNLDAALVMYDLGLDGGGQEMRDIMQLAASLYASTDEAKGLDPNSRDAEALMEQAVQRALGQTMIRNEAHGGVQEVMGQMTLLPPSVSGKAADESLRRAADRMWTETEGDKTVLRRGLWQEAWESASRFGSVPMVGPVRMTPDMLTSGRVSLVPYSATEYRMVVDGGTPVQDAQGRLYVFDIQKLIEGTRNPPEPLLEPLSERTGASYDGMMVAP